MIKEFLKPSTGKILFSLVVSIVLILIIFSASFDYLPILKNIVPFIIFPTFPIIFFTGCCPDCNCSTFQAYLGVILGIIILYGGISYLISCFFIKTKF